ncbi:MAG: hypothetical protein IPP33_15825 [Flavobacteriales bacterium]|nr:hypothetical protein [Flavobacteriales bacterium]
MQRPGLLLFFFCAASIGCAQQLQFQHLSTDDGLSNNAITCMYQDRAGYIWIGTERGLNLYDGTTVQRIEGTDLAIASVIEDRAGIIWIATKDHGLIRYDRTSRERQVFNRADTLASTMASEKLTALYDLNDTTLLIGSREVSLMFLDKRTQHFSYWLDSASISPALASIRPSNSHGWCHALVPLDEKRLWIGFLNSYLSVVADRGTFTISHFVRTRRPGFETQTSAALSDGYLCMGGWQNGIDVVEMRDLPTALSSVPVGTRVMGTEEEVTAIVPWQNGELMVGIRQLGLYRVELNSGKMVRMSRDRSDPSSLGNDRVRCLLKDRNGTLWVGTANGLDFHVPATWGFTALDLFGAAQGNQQDVFFHRVEGTGPGGARIFSSTGFFVQDSVGAMLRHERFDHAGRALQPTVMANDHDDVPLIGTEYGIARGFAGNGGPASALEPISSIGMKSTLGSMYQVRGIAPDTLNGNAVYLIATLGFGVHVVDAATQRIIGSAMPNAATKLNTLYLVNSMAKSRGGTYWFGSAGGLFHWDRHDQLILPAVTDTGEVVPGDVVALGEDVRQVLLLHDTVWAITHNGILLQVVDDRSSNHVPPLWLRGAMHGITADQHGRLWITMDDGLLRFDPADGSFIRVPVNDGQRFKKLTGAITTLADGRIAMCADNSLITFQPEEFDHLPELPSAYLTGTWAAGMALNVQDASVELTYRSSVIEIGVSALAFGFPEQLVLEYKLDGVEEEWRTTSLRENIRYAGVPIGSHSLLVKVRDAFGRVGPEQALLIVSVNAPFWLKWWFYVALLAIVAIALWAYFRLRFRQQVRLQRMRDRIARDLHDDIGSTLGSISYFSEAVKQRIAQNDAPGAQAVLDRIGENSREMIDQMHDIVWSVDPRKDAFGELSGRMRSFASEMLGPLGVAVHMEEDPALAHVKLSMEQRKGIFLIFKEAVFNAAKHAKAKNMLITLRKQGRDLSITVVDDGVGPAASNGSAMGGNGLDNMHKRAAELGGSCTISPGKLSGTVVHLRLPLHAPLPAIGD